MELQITGKNMRLTPEMRKLIEHKLAKLRRHLPNMTESKVEVTEEKTRSPQQRFVVQITIDSSGTLLRAEERAESMFNAIDKAVAIMDRQIEHYKGKLYKKGRGSSLARGEFHAETGSRNKEERVIRRKKFVVEPMGVPEAIDKMEILGHDFFLFLNEGTDKLNLLYRRRNNGYGLIEPQLE